LPTACAIKTTAKMRPTAATSAANPHPDCITVTLSGWIGRPDGLYTYEGNQLDQ
jgi:hypothetical protein